MAWSRPGTWCGFSDISLWFGFWGSPSIGPESCDDNLGEDAATHNTTLPHFCTTSSISQMFPRCGLPEAKPSFLRHKMLYWCGAALGAILHAAFGQGVSHPHCSCRCVGQCRVCPQSPGGHPWMGRGLWEVGQAADGRRGWWGCPHIGATDTLTGFRQSNLCLKGNSVNQQQGGHKLRA